jgi:hypothetical protein
VVDRFSVELWSIVHFERCWICSLTKREVAKVPTCPPDVNRGEVASDLTPAGRYDVKLVKVRNARGRPGEVTKRFVFRITAGCFKNRVIPYFTAVDGRDHNFFLKLVLHFLGYSFRSTEDIDFKRLKDRKCRVKIEHRERNGRIFAQIVGFEFADDQRWG